MGSEKPTTTTTTWHLVLSNCGTGTLKKWDRTRDIATLKASTQPKKCLMAKGTNFTLILGCLFQLLTKKIFIIITCGTSVEGKTVFHCF